MNGRTAKLLRKYGAADAHVQQDTPEERIRYFRWLYPKLKRRWCATPRKQRNSLRRRAELFITKVRQGIIHG